MYFLLNCITSNINSNSKDSISISMILFVYVYLNNNNKIKDHIIIYSHPQLRYQISISILPQIPINNLLSYFIDIYFKFSNYDSTSLSQLLCIATFFISVSILFYDISTYSVSDSIYVSFFLKIDT